jgi:hypothetical protein
MMAVLAERCCHLCSNRKVRDWRMRQAQGLGDHQRSINAEISICAIRESEEWITII